MEEYLEERIGLVEEIRRMGITDEQVLEAIFRTPRHRFIKTEPYGNYPIPIGWGQTLSQPYTVAFMLQALELKPGCRVLEVGGGSGYSAAVMSRLVGQGNVFSIEIVPQLAERARGILRELGIGNVRILTGDSSLGYEQEAPYDRIVIAAACPRIPPPLASQLSEDGVLVAPVEAASGQDMVRLKRGRRENLGGFVFVPLTGRYGKI